MYTLNTATNEIWETANPSVRGLFAGADPVYQAYQAWHLADPDAHQLVSVDLPPPAPRLVSKGAVMDRLRDHELAALYTLAKTNVAVEVWLKKFEMREEIDLDSPKLLAGLNVLAAVGVLDDAGRPAEIVA